VGRRCESHHVIRVPLGEAYPRGVPHSANSKHRHFIMGKKVAVLGFIIVPFIIFRYDIKLACYSITRLKSIIAT
jgi:hypothetical protein